MSNYLLTVSKGLYPPYLFFVALGIAFGIAARKWRPFDTLLLVFFLVFELFAATQVRIFYGKWETSRRYMWIGIPLYLPFAARGVETLWNILRKKPIGRYAAGLLCAAFAVLVVWNSYLPVIQSRCFRKKRIERGITHRAAAWIRKDWDAATAPAAPRMMRCDQYQSGRRPLVQSPWLRVGYFCGGQAYTEYLGFQGETPDYIITPDRNAVFPDHVLVGTVSEGEQKAYIHRRRRQHP